MVGREFPDALAGWNRSEFMRSEQTNRLFCVHDGAADIRPAEIAISLASHSGAGIERS
jgi:hypothetical protein